MRRPTALVTAAMLACTLALQAASASASISQESTFQDDNRLVYDTPENVAKTLDQLRSLGVDRVRISVFWKVVAPDAKSREKPQFDATDPAAYPHGAWDRYDAIVRLAKDRGLGVNFNLTDPAPLWATGTPEREDIAETFEPNAREFDLFTRAVGTRYSGSYTPKGATGPLPRIDYWAIWNEPNQSGWLTPQWVADARDPSGQVEASPRIYRDLADAAYDGLESTGHGSDTILVGETAPKGLNVTGTTRSMKPGRFIRRLYCLDDLHQPLTATAAEVRGCPKDGDRARFIAQHPVLFKMTGWAHHPYELTFAPTVPPTDPDYFTIGNLDAFGALLRQVFASYGQPIPGGGRDMPLYLTEYGYQTNPPDPIGVSLLNQSRYLNASEYLAARNPAVRTLAQFLLTDDRPLPGYPRGSVGAYGGTFQTGLQTEDNRQKPAYATYKLPIHLPKRTIIRGSRLRVWGLVRAAPEGPTQVTVEIRTSRRGSKWRAKKTVTVANMRHYVDTRVKVRTKGFARLVWKSPSGDVLTSRAASFLLRDKPVKRKSAKPVKRAKKQR